MSGMMPMFSAGQVLQYAQKFHDRIFDDMVMKLMYVGEEFIVLARQNGEYQDQTGNLRNSIGYAVLVGTEIKKKSSQGPKGDGNRTSEIIELVRGETGKGVVSLVCWAGMEYARYVENRNFDVITNSANQAQQILKDLLNE